MLTAEEKIVELQEIIEQKTQLLTLAKLSPIKPQETEEPALDKETRPRRKTEEVAPE